MMDDGHRQRGRVGAHLDPASLVDVFSPGAQASQGLRSWTRNCPESGTDIPALRLRETIAAPRAGPPRRSGKALPLRVEMPKELV